MGETLTQTQASTEATSALLGLDVQSKPDTESSVPAEDPQEKSVKAEEKSAEPANTNTGLESAAAPVVEVGGYPSTRVPTFGV